ncbi:MAG: tripartite tricarboxylate transporter TctB family protein [Halieaceae bacterium]|nr:tripartite tricarboxylate transporter TctB family protein [Halieaceae bacterium]
MIKIANLAIYVILATLGYLSYQSAQTLPEGLFGDIGAAALPSALGIALIVLAALGIIQEVQLKPNTKQLFEIHLRQWALKVLLITAFIGAWQLIGYFFAFLPLFLFTSFCCFGTKASGASLLKNALLAGGLTLGAYSLFVLTLDIQFG